MQYLYWLNHLQPHDRPLVGEAAYSLGLATQQGYSVLPGVIIAAPLLMHFLESVEWGDPLFSDFPHSPIHMDVGNPSQLQAIAQRIQASIQAQSLPHAEQDNIYEAVQSLHSTRVILQPSLGLKPSQQTSVHQVQPVQLVAYWPLAQCDLFLLLLNERLTSSFELGAALLGVLLSRGT